MRPRARQPPAKAADGTHAHARTHARSHARTLARSAFGIGTATTCRSSSAQAHRREAASSPSSAAPAGRITSAASRPAEQPPAAVSMAPFSPNVWGGPRERPAAAQKPRIARVPAVVATEGELAPWTPYSSGSAWRAQRGRQRSRSRMTSRSLTASATGHDGAVLPSPRVAPAPLQRLGPRRAARSSGLCSVMQASRACEPGTPVGARPLRGAVLHA